MNDLIINEEKNKLKKIIKDYEEVLEDSKLEYENIYSLYKDNLEELETKKIRLNSKIKTLEKNIDKPYFARIDFTNNTDNITDTCYIGKVGVSDYDNNIITVDWRSPIASLYYDSNVGECSFYSNNTKITGNLTLKRQYDIEKRQLLDIRDVDTVSTDELLKPYLASSADSRLKNIVSTIQEEQNNIIRSNINKNLIIQGVAGSGKTTVALHRIAYLVYNYKEKFNSDEFMVIGPNKFFINYISSVLPDLDVNDVPEYDLLGLTENFLGQKITLNKTDKTDELIKYVGNMDIKNDIDSYFKAMFNNLKNLEIKIESFTLLNNSEIFTILKKEKLDSYDNMKDIIERYIFLLSKHVNSKKEYFLEKLNNFIDKKLNDTNLIELRKERDYIRGEIKKDIIPIITKAFKSSYLNPLEVYKEILMKEKNYNITNINIEDLPPLLYINYKTYGNKNYIKYKHIVIDEAQDYSDLLFFTLKKLFKNSTFSIYGDLAQSLYPKRSISSWESVVNYTFNNNVEIINLNKSYRTSIEIMTEANKINSHLSLNLAIPVIRHSKPVNYEKNSNPTKILDKVKYLQNNYNTIGIISKEENTAKDIYNYLLKNNIEINYIDEKNQEYKGGICSLTGSLSKGLEFDAVIITDADNQNYNINNTLDMKILYVSMTRALHELDIYYNNDLVSILK